MKYNHSHEIAMRHWSNRLLPVLVVSILSPSLLLTQDVYVVGEVLTDTTFRFVVRNSGPRYLMHYVVTSCDTVGASCAAEVQIFSASNGKKVQEWRDTISFETPFCSFPEQPTFVDFNFDGYKDICFECSWSGYRESFQFLPESTLHPPVS